MSKTAWKAFPYPDPAYVYAGTALKKQWARLHQGDAEPWPSDTGAQAAWRAYHAGEFAKAVSLSIRLYGNVMSGAVIAAILLGIAPIYALARTALRAGAPRVRVFHAHRDRATAMLVEALATLAADHPDRLQIEAWFDAADWDAIARR